WGVYSGLWTLRTRYGVSGDPPLPDIPIARATPPPGARVTAAAVAVAPQYAGPLEGILLAPFTTLTATLQARWPSTAWNTFESTALSASGAALYDASGFLLGTGAVQAAPVHSTTVAIVHGAPLQVALAGTGTASFYAPALAGLGVGGDWITYTAQLSAAEAYTLTLFDAIVTLNGGSTYTGDFFLVVTGTASIMGSGHTAVPNFAGSAALQVQEARVVVGPAAGTFRAGGQPVDVSGGLALAGYTGPLTVTEATSATDRIELAGDASFFTLRLDPASSTTDPNTPVTFRALVAANFADTYTVTAAVPEGWGIAIGKTGRITATPPLGAAPGDYAVRVTARSAAYPGLSLSAVHTVTTTPYQGMALDEDILHGSGPGNFGWLTWTGDRSEGALARSLTPPGDSYTYIDPDDPSDHVVSVGDWGRGRPGVADSRAIREALDALMTRIVIVPVWDEATGQGANARYRVVGFAWVQLTAYHLPGRDRISAVFWGWAGCGP
ncbi:MAG: hypothetical protein ACP5OO_07515, partial [Chloroflexia bacterium]